MSAGAAPAVQRRVEGLPGSKARVVKDVSGVAIAPCRFHASWREFGEPSTVLAKAGLFPF